MTYNDTDRAIARSTTQKPKLRYDARLINMNVLAWCKLTNSSIDEYFELTTVKKYAHLEQE